MICLSSLGLFCWSLYFDPNQLVFIIFSYNFSRLYNASVNVSRTVKYSPTTCRPHPFVFFWGVKRQTNIRLGSQRGQSIG